MIKLGLSCHAMQSLEFRDESAELLRKVAAFIQISAMYSASERQKTVKAAQPFLQGGYGRPEDGWLLIEFWVASQDKILECVLALMEECSFNVEQ